MSLIIPNLFIGDMHDARNVKNVSMIVNCTVEIPFYNNNTKNYRVSVKDNLQKEEFKKLYDYIKFNDCLLFKELDNNISQKKNVLVHCAAGAQRSCAFVVCFLIWKYKLNINDTIQFVKSKREIAFFRGVNFIQTIQAFHSTI